MARIQGKVLAVERPLVAHEPGTWAVTVIYAVPVCWVETGFQEKPQVGDEVDEHVLVRWVKPDDERPGQWVAGVTHKLRKKPVKRTVFTNYRPAIYSTIGVDLL